MNRQYDTPTAGGVFEVPVGKQRAAGATPQPALTATKIVPSGVTLKPIMPPVFSVALYAGNVPMPNAPSTEPGRAGLPAKIVTMLVGTHGEAIM
jgi:hypothetical protein